jgi:hypothetical protein
MAKDRTVVDWSEREEKMAYWSDSKLRALRAQKNLLAFADNVKKYDLRTWGVEKYIPADVLNQMMGVVDIYTVFVDAFSNLKELDDNLMPDAYREVLAEELEDFLERLKRTPTGDKTRALEKILECALEIRIVDVVHADEMAFWADYRARFRQIAAKSVVSIDGKYGTITISPAAKNVILENYGRTVGFVQLVTKDRYAGKFWIRPVTRIVSGKKRVANGHKTGQIASISAVQFLEQIGFKDKPTQYFSAKWDPKNSGLVVDIRNPLN